MQKPLHRVPISATPEGDGPALPLPQLQVERRADNPLERLAHFVANQSGRTLLLAESLGRRETMAGFLAEYGLKPALLESWAEFEASKESFCLGVGPLYSGF